MAHPSKTLPVPTRFRDGSERNALEIEIDCLAALGQAEITSLGSENLYATKDGLHYYSKVYNTEDYQLGAWDFSVHPCGCKSLVHDTIQQL